MPSATASPHHPSAMPTISSSTGGTDGATRPPLMKRQSSASSHASRQTVLSPGSVGEQAPLRHTVKARHAKIVLPRNHSSARNLAKLARQAQNANTQAQRAEDGRKFSRQRSHDGDTEIRLPGSLDESVKPSMRRNMTATILPRNTSHAKLKKNLSHGQLTRLGSGRNLVALNNAAHKGPPSGVKEKSKRAKSADLTGMTKDLQEQDFAIGGEARPFVQQGWENTEKKVGFAVGSVGDASDEEDVPAMEGSGMQEDEWTEESASASPFSTRQNTANNSRRPSVVVDRMNEKLAPLAGRQHEANTAKSASERWASHSAPDQDQDSEDESSEPISPHSVDHHIPEQQEQRTDDTPPTQEPPQTEQNDHVSHETSPVPQTETIKAPTRPLASQRSVSTQSKELKNPTTRRLLDKSHHLPAPALVSNVSAMDDTHSIRDSSPPSMRSSKSNMADSNGEIQEDELVSRFVPSTSHPSMGSAPNTALGTPRTGLHTPEEDSNLATQRRGKSISGFQLGPVSPGSTVSAGSSGTTTPAIGRSRTELRMLQEKAMADLETAADHRPHLPAHIYDRRNESLKSYLNIAGLGDGRRGHGAPSVGPDLFQGRFRALNTELKVVQKFRDPLGEAVVRLRGYKGSRLNRRSSAPKQHANALTTSKSAISLPARRAQRELEVSKSASPPKMADALHKGTLGAQSAVQIQRSERQKGRREVSFAETPPNTSKSLPEEDKLTPNVIARHLWNAV